MNTGACLAASHRPDRARRRLLRRTTLFAKRSLMLGFGGTLMVAGVVAVPTPVPGLGLVLFVGGLYFAARGSKVARRAVKWSRRQSPVFSRGLERIKPRLPRPMRRFIDQSDPLR